MTTPRKLVKTVLKRDNNLCVIRSKHCTRTATTADHRANRGHGGSSVLDAPECLIACCRLCNGWKEDSVGDDREQLIRRGIRVLKAATNALTYLRCLETPVLYPDGEWYVLTGDDRQQMLPAEVAEYLSLVTEGMARNG